ncbi:MAG: hypothetical protein JNM43_02230 [Planctomycetaceae bacterium]|nr:hypothetical protein [Planctomycetaceae bacterium]
MRIDLKKDFERVVKCLAERCKDFPVYVNAGPGEDENAIRLITLGFQFDQAGWIALVFDTRPEAACDGEWQSYIEENAEPFQGWFKAFDDMVENDSVLSLTQHNGTRRSFTANSELQDIAECFGVMCRDALLKARKMGLFNELPLADDCKFSVEEHNGNYAWLEGDISKDAVSDDEVMDSMRRAAKKLSKTMQIEYWIGQLDHVAAGKLGDASTMVYSVEFILKEISKLGKTAIIPLLKWANTWADKPEFRPPETRKKGENISFPNQHALFSVFRALMEWGTKIPDAEPHIHEYIQTAIKVRRSDGHFGIVPFHAARLLHYNYDSYPEPVVEESTNQLLNAEHFTGGLHSR